MKTTRYTTTSKKVIAIALALVLFATIFTGCNRTNEEEITTTTTTEVQTTIEVVTEIVTDEDGETVTDDNGEILTTEVTKVVEVTNQSEEDEQTSSKKASSTTSTTKGSSTSTTKQTETTTKKNSSSSSSNKVTTTTKPVTTTTKPTSTSCSHSWGEWKWSSAKECMISTCSKCGATMTPDDCNHTYGNWEYRYDSKYRKCTKCPHSETIEGDFTAQCMGSKSEYLELLGYVNEARREAGLNELVYLDELQTGCNTRAQELTQKFSHTRPDGSNYSTAYSNYKFTYLKGHRFDSCGENIVSGATTAEMAFGAWMNSAGHRKTILLEKGFGFVAAKCDDKWVMTVVMEVTE